MSVYVLGGDKSENRMLGIVKGKSLKSKEEFLSLVNSFRNCACTEEEGVWEIKYVLYHFEKNRFQSEARLKKEKAFNCCFLIFPSFEGKAREGKARKGKMRGN